MQSDSPTPKSSNTLQAVGWFFFACALFALSYCQAPLYFSNQYQYFLHGLAQGGHGNLSEDWLANTKDPTPIFSFVVAQTYRHLHEYAFYGYYALLMGVYFVSLVWLYSILGDKKSSLRMRWSYIAILLLVHSALLRFVSVRLLGTDYPWYFQAGLAGQYVLGPVWQPSTFGVFLVLSVCVFAADKPMLAVVCSSVGAVLHTTYLLPAALLTLAYLCVLGYRKEWRQAFAVGGVALVIVLPIVVYNFMSFRPSSEEAFGLAQEILVHFRIPHHAIPRLWCDEVAIAQMVWIVLGALLCWGTSLSAVLLLGFGFGAALTGVQLWTENNTLSLVFPWRISVILIPVATAVILAKLVLWLGNLFSSVSQESKRWVDLFSGVGIGMALLGGVLITWQDLAFQSRPEEQAVLDHVRAAKKPGQVYFLPVQVPNLKPKIRGSQKSDYKPLKTREKDDRFIPVNLQGFRLETGAAIYVDFKSIPYSDTDVLEWKSRIDLTKEMVEALTKQVAAKTKEKPTSEEKKDRVTPLLPRLRKAGVTHLVIPIQAELSGSEVEEVYEGPHYRIYAFAQE